MSLFQQMHCLICHSVIQPPVGWRAIFSEEKEQIVCPKCEKGFEKIAGDTCRICCRMFQSLNESFRKVDICHDCFRWERDEEWKGYLDSNHSILVYNDFLKEVLATYKFRGDYLLSKVFADYLTPVLHTLDTDLLVPIPLSGERLYERGFNQAEALILEAGSSPTRLLTRIHSEKQSKKSRSERIHIPQVFQITPNQEITGKSIVLVDDIYTTGSTLRHAAKLLMVAGAKSIKSVTIAR